MQKHSLIPAALLTLALSTGAQDSWTQLTNLPSNGSGNYTSTFFTSTTTGYVLFNPNGTSSPSIYKTTNGAVAWTRVNVNMGGTSSLKFIHCPNPNTCYALGSNNGRTGFFKTTDGTNWSSWIEVGGSNGIYFVKADTGFVVGNGGAILKTVNGGSTWATVVSGTTLQLNSVHFPSTSTGYVVGANGVIRKTINGGDSWSALSTGATRNLNSIFCPAVNSCFAVGDSGTILKTVDGGSSWSFRTIISSASISSVFFLDASTGYAAGTIITGAISTYQHLVLKTTDGGTTWTYAYLASAPQYSSLNSIHFPNASIGYAVGGSSLSNPVILQDVVTTGIHSLNSSREIFRFGENGDLRYQLSNRSRVQTLLFDYRGRMALKLLDATQDAGSYNLVLPAGNLSQGAYILDFRVNGLHKAVRVPGN